MISGRLGFEYYVYIILIPIHLDWVIISCPKNTEIGEDIYMRCSPYAGSNSSYAAFDSSGVLATLREAHSYRLGLVTWRYQFRVPVGTDICHRGCAYTDSAPNCSTVLPMVLCTIKNPSSLTFKLRVEHSHGFGLPSVNCHDSAGSDVKQYSLRPFCFIVMV